MNGRRRLFVLLYSLSGAAALVYEVAWTRLLALHLGHTVAAASTVLAAFMGGLAVGAAAGSRLVARLERTPAALLRAYAGLEILVAAAALLLPIALGGAEPLLAWAYADGQAPARFAVVRVAISLLLLGIPAAAMGATFPAAVAWFANGAADAGALYAANTFGAAAGAIAAGFRLIPLLGLRGTSWVGVALNAAAAGGALWLASAPGRAGPANAPAAAVVPPVKRGKPPRTALRAGKSRTRAAPPAPRVPQPRLAAAIAALCGGIALVYEVAWTRLLALVLGPTTYAFATMAAAFIAGLAIGSSAGARLARGTRQPAAWLGGVVLAGSAAAVLAASFAATRLPLVVAREVAAPDAALAAVVAAQALRVGLLIVPIAITLGAAFTLALAVAAGESPGVAAPASRVYAWNTAGAIAGALAGGFLLVPALGLRPTFLVAAAAGAIGGGACLAASPPSRRRAIAALAATAAVVAAMAAAPAWDRDLLASGAYKYAPYLESSVFEPVLHAGRLEYYREGAAGTVSVRLLGGVRSLAIDGKIDASNGGDMLTQRLLGLLPVIIHGRAREICVIGLGSGVTAGAALDAGIVERADVVEISPEVVAASHLFDRENGSVLARPGVRLIVGDGRSHLRLTPRRYDVIVSEPSNPWMAGVASLFTREFFQAARAHLKPGGLLCQWAHTYDIEAGDLRSIVATFSSVFPQGTIWLVGEGDVLLIGGVSDAPPALDHVAGRLGAGAVARALDEVAIPRAHAAFAVLSLFAGGPRELQAFASQAPLQTDDRTALEFSAPRGIYGRSANDNGTAIAALLGSRPPRERGGYSAAVQAVFDGATESDWAARGRMELKADAYQLAYDAFRRASRLNPADAGVLGGLSQAAALARKTDEELAWLTSVAAADPRNAAVRVERSHLLAAAGDFERAVEAAQEAMAIAPGSPEGAEQLASVLADAGDAGRLAAVADELLRRFPGDPSAHYFRASAWFMSGRPGDAEREARAALAGRPGDARALNLIGAACATRGDRACAKTALEASIRANPRDSSAYVNLALFLMQEGNVSAAQSTFAEALAVDPTSASARSGYEQARVALEKP